MKISVITPTWNQAEFIEDTIKSVLQQTYQDAEYIIVDNLSDDGTEEIVRNYMKKYPNIIYVREKDCGQADAINKGLERVTGDIVCWLNSDDFYYTDTVFQTVITAFETNPEAGVIVGNGYYCDRNGNFTEPIECNRHVKDWVLSRWYYILQPAVFWKRNDLRLDVKLHYVFDWKFFIQMQKMSCFHFIDDCLTAYRMYEDNKTGLDNAGRKKEVYLLQKELQESKWNTAWCKLVYQVYENAEKSGRNGNKKLVNLLSRVLFHVTGKRICSF
ncbi:MAG: glycosyltransferase family 2 protein [Lachnospiraceae bacterium]|nr:glycosyltransferase family 2 protein [Lachnospiraceae bacterium]